MKAIALFLLLLLLTSMSPVVAQEENVGMDVSVEVRVERAPRLTGGDLALGCLGVLMLIGIILVRRWMK